MDLAEARLRLEDIAPQLEEVALRELLLGGGLDVGLLVDRIELTPLDGVEQDLCRLLDALEEAIVLGTAGGRLLVGMMLEDLLAVGALDLVLGGLVAIPGETEYLVMVLRLIAKS